MRYKIGFGSDKIEVEEELGEQNMDDVNTLADFLSYSIKKCAADGAEQYFFHMSDHGAGWYGFGGDEETRRLLKEHGPYARRLGAGVMTLGDLHDGVKKGLTDSGVITKLE